MRSANPVVVVDVDVSPAPVDVAEPRDHAVHSGTRSATAAVEATVDAEEEPGLDRPPRPAYARGWIRDGQPERALAAADLALARGHHGATWQMVRGDALHAMDRHEEAVQAYEVAALGYGSALAARACFAAAATRWRHLHDAEGALTSLERLRCTEGDPVASRQARRLHEQLVQALGRDRARGRALADP